jgi:hypothetical protein
MDILFNLLPQAVDIDLQIVFFFSAFPSPDLGK